MPSFEEEAFERARRMSHSRPAAPKPPKEPPKTENTERPEKPEKSEKPVVKQPEKPAPNMLETLFKDKETSLILMLLLLLADEKNDPSLLFTLMYLLM